MDVQALIEELGLSPHPAEGGYFVETYRSDEVVPAHCLHPRYGRDKAVSTAIYYLLTPETFSAMHRLKSDEVYHFYLGDPVEMLVLYPDGSHAVNVLGTEVLAGRRPQAIVPRGAWQGSRLVEDGKFALLGTTVAPAFDYEDYEPGLRAELILAYPECEELIKALTRE